MSLIDPVSDRCKQLLLLCHKIAVDLLLEVKDKRHIGWYNLRLLTRFLCVWVLGIFIFMLFLCWYWWDEEDKIDGLASLL